MILGNNIITVNQSKAMTDLLFDLEFNLMTAEDCIACVRQSVRYQPDLIVADLMSPHLNGMSMARILNTLMIRTPIVLTAHDRKYQKHALSFKNVVGFVSTPGKGSPFPRDNIRSELEAILFTLENITPEPAEYAYSFRQREWASLLSKSGQKKVLLIEDDRAVKREMLRILDSADAYELYNAADGLEGIFKALLIEPDLILTDICMPNLDGLAMCQIFNILHKPFPVVFVTTMDQREIPQKAFRAQGVLGIIEKSLLQDKQAFIDKVASYLAQVDSVKKNWEIRSPRVSPSPCT